ncbi:hypothetical protein [uncultured Desulfobacter sp.]|uniref:hypothetical protein n=1 Tax=uncultured Desulfobacter sp. TaxID=240139 RepID=UPI002AAB1130|nr:hypothetical protein [uncultured Desulfobacter sp.]
MNCPTIWPGLSAIWESSDALAFTWSLDILISSLAWLTLDEISFVVEVCSSKRISGGLKGFSFTWTVAEKLYTFSAHDLLAFCRDDLPANIDQAVIV